MLYIIISFVILFDAQLTKADIYRNQQEFVEKLKEKGNIKSKVVADVMSQVDRYFYVTNSPYEDFSSITDPGAIDSAPSLSALALENLKDHLKPGSKVLDVGYGSGYLSVCMALMVGSNGSVFGIESKLDQEDYAKNCVMDDINLSTKIIHLKFLSGDVSAIASQYGPYDVIHVSPAVRKVPEVLVQQLKVGGRLMIPVGDASLAIIDHLTMYDKLSDGSIKTSIINTTLYVHRVLW